MGNLHATVGRIGFGVLASFVLSSCMGILAKRNITSNDLNSGADADDDVEEDGGPAVDTNPYFANFNLIPIENVVIIYNSIDPAGPTCDGLLLTAEYVLAKADCLETLQPGISSAPGLASNLDVTEQGLMEIKDPIFADVHPSYNSTTFAYNIAVLQLSNSFSIDGDTNVFDIDSVEGQARFDAVGTTVRVWVGTYLGY